MRAAVVTGHRRVRRTIGRRRRATDRRAPPTTTVLLDVLAVALNPVDVAIGIGRFYAGHPPLPYVPGIECVGRTAGVAGSSTPRGRDRGSARDGFAAEQVAVPASALIDIPGDTDPAVGRRPRERPGWPDGCR